MCTYNISVDDALMEQVRPAFADNDEINQWMQSQIVSLLQKMATNITQNQCKPSVSKRLRGIAAHAPKDFDYKKEIETRF